MSDNPFQTPLELPRGISGVRIGNLESLKKVAQNQRGVLACILAEILIVVAQIVLRPMVGPDSELLAVLAPIALLASGVLAAVFVFRLAVNVYHPAVGASLGILALIPCIGLVALLTINAKANDVLRQNGIHVGLMGARASDLASLSPDSP
ncbi:MAG TPA: hypothetical protein VL175_08195 [Pirellulales bacterium]|jgi:hypothetical protein|nr:hypothetical protein [Pirellulales bacterium]